jgi:uncharacterized protein with gpF-like domain
MWIYTLDLFEVKFRITYARLRNRYMRAVANDYKTTGEINPRHLIKYKDDLDKALQAHYSKVMPYYAKDAQKQFKGKAKVREKKAISPFQALIAEWVIREGFNNARLIASTDSDSIVSVVEQGMLEGASIPQISKSIQQKTSLTASRAIVVSRTETHGAATFAVMESAREAETELGIQLMKQWIATDDDRTRDIHAEMIGSDPIPMDEMFYVGGEYMDRPNDRSASPENYINCRCQVVFSERE